MFGRATNSLAAVSKVVSHLLMFLCLLGIYLIKEFLF